MNIRAFTVALIMLWLTLSQGATNTSSCHTTNAPSALNKFSTSLYQGAVRKVGKVENVIISPSSAAAVLGMVLAGAGGNTALQLKTTLGVSRSKDPVCTIGQLTKSRTQSKVIKSFNRILVAVSFTQKESFRSALFQHYGVSSESFNFTSENARKNLNQQVEELTNRRIKNVFKQGMFDALTKAVLMNVVYFKAAWQKPFDPKMTHARPFYSPSSKRPIQIKMMGTRGRFRVADLQEADARALELPYAGKTKLSMIILLPNRRNGLNFLESAMSSKHILDKLTQRLKNFKRQRLTVVIPKFIMETSLRLGDVLKQMGITDLFDPAKADLSGITGDKSLYVNQAFQKAFIQVNEEGTEASAATVALVSARRLPQMFVANHPFVFLIRDDRTGAIPFIGRFVTPNFR